jgi:hypothetical protein
MSDNKSRGRRPDGLADRCPPALSVSDRLDLLANGCRRATLRYLAERPNRPVCLDTLVDYLSGKDFGDRQSVRISLLHLHLPKLARADVVTYDEGERRVRYVRHPDIEDLLAFVEEE